MKPGAMGDDQSVQNQMKTIHIHFSTHTMQYVNCAACTIILHLSACSVKLQVQAHMIHVLA